MDTVECTSRHYLIGRGFLAIQRNEVGVVVEVLQ